MERTAKVKTEENPGAQAKGFYSCWSARRQPEHILCRLPFRLRRHVLRNKADFLPGKRVAQARALVLIFETNRSEEKRCGREGWQPEDNTWGEVVTVGKLRGREVSSTTHSMGYA